MSRINSYYLSFKLIYALIRYNVDKYSLFIIKKSFYKGLNSEKIPIKIIEPLNESRKVFILYPGASPFAEDHPKMLMLGHILAKNGFRVYIPRIPPLKKLDVTHENIKWFSCFYVWMINDEKVKPEDIIMAGISYGGGLMLRMLIDNYEKLPMPKSILTFGTYANSKSLFNFFINGEIVVDEQVYTIKPNEWGLIVIFHNYLKNLTLDWDSSNLQKAIQQKINNSDDKLHDYAKNLTEFEKDLFFSIISGKANLGVKKLTYMILENEEEAYKKLSPKYGADKLTDKVFILHGANDSMVPFIQSIQLSNYLPNTELCISYLYEHKEIATNRSFVSVINQLFKLIKFYSKLFFHYEN